MVSPEHVLAAAARLEGIANRTPVMTSRTLDQWVSASVFLKCENFQRVGAFKFRGAYNAVSQLSNDEKAVGVITHSSGNHAQGLALAAQLHQVKATIVMPHDAPANKRRATEAYGATIVECEAQDREEVTAALIAEHGYTLIHPYDNDHIIAGQGTAALELFDETGALDFLFVPVGGGGLISGSALAAQVRSPNCRVIGVEPELARDATDSWQRGDIVKLADVPRTIADGLRTRSVGVRNLQIMSELVADMITVTEEEIFRAVEFAWGRLKLVIEPSSAVALAPLLSGTYHLPAGSRAGVLISGGNVDVASCGFFHRDDDASISTGAESDTSDDRITITGSATTTAQRADRPRVLISTELDGSLIHALEEIAIVELKPGLELDPVPTNIEAYSALIAGPRQAVGPELLENGYNLRVIGSIAFHPDNIDVSTARAMGVKVIFAPTEKEITLADQTIARLVKIAESSDEGMLDGKTLGLVGFGPVGRLVAERARAFGMQVVVNQPRLTAELALESDVRAADLNELLATSEYISLHLPLHSETTEMIGASELQRTRKGAVLLNGGHPKLIDEQALLAAIESGQIAAAAVPRLTSADAPIQPYSTQLRQHPGVLAYEPITTPTDRETNGVAQQVVAGVIDALKAASAPKTLDLEVVPVEQVVPHEHIDQKRVRRLMSRLEEDGLLVNPPITTQWKGRYIILDGATRHSALSGLGYPHAIVQVVPATHSELQLHTWYHAISPEPQSDGDTQALLHELSAIEGLQLAAIEPVAAQNALAEPGTLCYFKTRADEIILASASATHDRLTVMNAVVDTYNAWGQVERTLLTDLDRLTSLFPRLAAVAIFPQFAPSDVFDAAAAGRLLPAGLTRFVIPGRILRLNAELSKLKADEPLEAKRAWFESFLASRLSQSRLRYYQEPVILLDE